VSEWRRIQGFRGVSRLRVTVTSDADIELRANQSVHGPMHLSAGELFDLHGFIFPDSFSLWLRSDDPNCQCLINAEYTENVTRPIHELIDGPVENELNRAFDMRFLYGPMGLGIPMGITGNPVDYHIHVPPNVPISVQVPPPTVGHPAPRPYEIVRERHLRRLREERKEAEPSKEEKPCPGITRLQAFKRELEEEKPKKKRKRGEKKKW